MLVETRRRTYWLAVLFATCSAAALFVDMPVARYVHHIGVPGDLRKLFTVSEVFAHGIGVALILLAVAVLDPASRRRLLRVALGTYGAGLIAQLAKLLLPRVRPNVCDLTGGVWQTFFAGGAQHYAQLHQLAGRDIQSFPSGHSATAVGLAFGLAWLYPRGRWLFVFFAILAITQRIESSAHFVSDTLAGVAIACVVAAVCWHQRGLNQLFTRFELRTTT